MVAIKRATLTVIFFLLAQAAFCLEMTDIQDSLADAFFNLVDDNEGLTSFPSLNITSGGREESLGGAFTGLADDICFFDYNPAASCILQDSEVAVFHNSWISDSNLETFAWADRFGDLGLGTKIKCFYVPFTQYDDTGERVAKSYYSETSAVINVSYNFFHGYYFKGLAVGGNLKLAWRSIPDYAENGSHKVIKGSGLEQSSLGIMADVGIMMSFSLGKMYNAREPNLRVGLSVLNLGAALTGFGKEVCIDDPLPTAANVGISYRPIKRLAITADFNKPMNLQDFSKSVKWSAGVGIDVTVTKFMEIMAGFRLKGANPRFSLGSEFKIKKITFDVNYTFDLTSSINPVNHFSLSARINLGDKGRKARELKCTELYTQGIDEYTNGNLEEAVACWKAALEQDKSFTPAKKWIDTVRPLQDQLDRMQDYQSLD